MELIENNKFEIPQNILMPIIPGYYYSSVVLTKDDLQDKTKLKSENYLGTILGDATVSPEHLYIYYVSDSAHNPILISQYLMPKDKHVYLLSSEVSTIGSLNIHRDCPAGRIAYFAKDGNDFKIIMLKDGGIDTRNRVWCDVFVAGHVQADVTDVENLNISSIGEDDENKIFSQYIRDDNDVWEATPWHNIKSDWSSTNPQLLEEFNNLANNYIYLWEINSGVWGTLPSEDTPFKNSRLQLTKWTKIPLGSAVSSDTQTITIKRELYRKGFHLASVTTGTNKSKIEGWYQIPGKYKLDENGNYVYAEGEGEYDVIFIKDSSGKYKLVKSGGYYVYDEHMDPNEERYRPSGVTNSLILDEFGKPSKKQIVIHNRETWENIHILTAWWRVVINDFLKSTNDGPAIFNFYKNGNGWSGSNKNFCIKNDILNIAFTYRGQISVISHPDVTLFNGETYYNLPDSMLFSITTKNAHIFGGIGMYIGNFVDTNTNTYEIYTQSSSINESSTGGAGTTWLGDPIKNALVKIKINNINAIMSVNANGADAKNERYKIYYSPSQTHPIVELID